MVNIDLLMDDGKRENAFHDFFYVFFSCFHEYLSDTRGLCMFRILFVYNAPLTGKKRIKKGT